MKVIVKFGFEQMDMHRIHIIAMKDNIASARVAEKAGFIKEGLIRKGLIGNVITDYYIYGQLLDDYTKSIK